MKQLIITSLFILSNCAILFSQDNVLKKAQKLTNESAYADALFYYDLGLKQGLDSSEIAPEVANAYYELHDSEKGEEWYSLVVQNSSEPIDYYRYAQMLKSNGKYDQAHKYMEKYSTLNGADPRAQAELTNAEYFEEYSEPSERFNLTNEYSNEETSEFAPVYFGEKLVFCSDLSINGPAIKREDKTRNRPFLNLFVASLDSLGELRNITPFSENLNSSYHEGPATFNKNLTEIYFTRSNVIDNKKRKASDSQIKLKIFNAQRTDVGWSEPEEFAYNSDEYSVGHPALSTDGNTIYFVSDMPGGHGGTDLWKCELQGEQWGEPENLGSKFNTRGNEMFPFIHKDGTLYYSSDGLLGLGGLDIFECRLASTGLRKPRNLKSPLNSSKDDFGFTTNLDKTNGFISSNRKKGQKTDDIFFFRMIDKLPLSISGNLIDSFNSDKSENLKSAQIRILDSEGNILETKTLDNDGYFEFEVDPDSNSYTIQTNNGEGWKDNALNEKLTNISEDELYLGELDLGNVLLEPKRLSFSGIPEYDDSSMSLKGYYLTLTNKQTGKEELIEVQPDGSLEINLDPDTEYAIDFKKDGWLSTHKDFSSKDIQEENLTIQDILNTQAAKIEIGTMLNVENIYFDYNKSNIREDAEIELYELLKILNDNPTLIIEVASHTDARGSKGYNKKLSQKRAKSTTKWLVEHGISKKRIKPKGYGEASITNKCKNGIECSDSEHEKNRRTQFKIVGF